MSGMPRSEYTPWKINMEPENRPLHGKGNSFWKPSFSGSMLNFGSVSDFLGSPSRPLNEIVFSPSRLYFLLGGAWMSQEVRING